MSIEISRITEADFDNIIKDIYPSYFQESNYTNNLTPDWDNTRLVMQAWPIGSAFAAKDGDRVIGIAVQKYARTYYKEVEADVEIFYILPEYRGTGISRQLVAALVSDAKAANVAVTYTACMSGLGNTNNNLYVNLWGKFGFQVLGTVLIKG